jgi:hypothetical protein
VDESVIYQVPAEIMALARALVKHVRRQLNPLPDLSRTTTMLLDGPVAKVERARSASSFDYFVRISTLTKGRPAWVPLRGHRYFNQAAGQVANYCQVSVDGGPGRPGSRPVVSFTLLKKSGVEPLREEGPEIGLDYGMNTLFASSCGDLLGHGLFEWLRRVDGVMTTLSAELQHLGVKLSTNRRYRAFGRRIRAHVTNEVNRVLNRVISLHRPKTLVLEHLDFRYGGMSATMNRLLSRCGRRAVADKLAALAEDGIAVVLVNPAYTSQQCSRCAYIDSANRKGRVFSCLHCGHRSHCDTVYGARSASFACTAHSAAKVILQRRSLETKAREAQASLAPRVDGTWLWWNKEQVLGTLDRAFADRFGYTPTAVRARRAVLSDVTSRPKRANAPPLVTDLLVEERWPSAAGLVDVPRGKRARGVLQSAS